LSRSVDADDGAAPASRSLDRSGPERLAAFECSGGDDTIAAALFRLVERSIRPLEQVGTDSYGRRQPLLSRKIKLAGGSAFLVGTNHLHQFLDTFRGFLDCPVVAQSLTERCHFPERPLEGKIVAVKNRTKPTGFDIPTSEPRAPIK